MVEQSKIVKTVTEAAVLVGLSAGIGWVGKKSTKGIIHRRSFCKLYELWKVGSCTFWKYLPNVLSPRQKGHP